MKMKKAALIFALAFALPSLAQDKAGAQAAIEKAEMLRKEAAAAEMEWRFTGKRIKEAKAALEKGDFAQAEKLAERAQWESERALEQAKTAEQVWKVGVPK